jgi:hypothetical protein
MENNATPIDKRHQIIAWTLLGGLLFLRLPFLGGIGSFADPAWLEPAFQIGTYLLTAGLIWWERERLVDFQIDKLALSIILIFKPIQTLILAADKNFDHPLAFPHLASLAFWMIPLGLFMALWLSHTRIPKISGASWRWFGVGLLVGFISTLVTAFPTALEITKSQINVRVSILGILVEAPREFFFQIGYAAVTEEPLFRAFLWGYLAKAGWKTVWIWLFQAGLFMLGHIYYAAKLPFTFWVVIPIGALVLGALVWRSKTISSSLAAHAIMNTFGYPLANLIAVLRA